MNADSNQLKDIFVSFSTQKSLVDTVFFTLVEAINQRLFPDGTYLNSVVLADIFQISRTPDQVGVCRIAQVRSARRLSDFYLYISGAY